jgi:hypothetical protein
MKKAATQAADRLVKMANTTLKNSLSYRNPSFDITT